MKPTKRHPHRLTLTADEVAALLGISRAKAYDSIRAGELPSIRFGRRVLVPAQPFYELLGSTSSFVDSGGADASPGTGTSTE